MEKGIEAWREKIAPLAENLGNLFGFQSAASNDASAPDGVSVGSTRELVVDRLAKNIWNATQLPESPALVAGAGCAAGPGATFAVNWTHERAFAGTKGGSRTPGTRT